MLIKDLKNCEEFIAGDDTILRVLLHPDKESLDIRYSLAHAVVKPGKTTLEHILTTSEVYYIIDGKGIMHINEESEPVGPGQAIYIPPFAKQCITNSGETDLIFICIVYPAWRAENESITNKHASV